MNFLLSHWHCILPLATIIVAVIFMRDKTKSKKDEQHNLSDKGV